ncbi:MAG: ArsR family transcriptional regulator [Lentisphaerae bacterium]|nr:ArsR family transcriptional regulator [Lentisphaerota bacterium]
MVSDLINSDTMNAIQLHPTLWRTCRVLTGLTRLRLLRLLMTSRTLSVTEAAGRLRLSMPRASQELRRLNSRGLLAATRRGPEVWYRLQPDPEVPDAAAITEAIRAALRRKEPAVDAEFARIAFGYTYPRRLQIVRRLLDRPMGPASLARATGIPLRSLKRHLRILADRRLVRAVDGLYHVVSHPHPLQKVILRQLRNSPPPRPGS